MNEKIVEPRNAIQLDQYYRLRYEVLRKPWNQPFANTQDEWENRSIHALMMNEKGEAIAVGRLQINNELEGQIRSMAVRADERGQGLGSKMILHLEACAKEKKLQYIVLDARANAIGFYERHGYTTIGDSYLLFGEIKHVKMKKEI